MATPIIEKPATRRAFLAGMAAIAASTLVPRNGLAAEASSDTAATAGKPDSVFSGVHIGCITYSYRSSLSTAEEILKALVQDGLSEVELMGAPIQKYAGMAVAGKGKPAPKVTDSEREAQLAKCRELRTLYNDAGINIHNQKIGFGQSDEEIDFNFEVAKALGCKGITTERNDTLAKKLAPFADKHKIWVAFHNHTTNYPVMDKPDPILDLGQYIGFNLDCGHYVAGSKGLSPIPVIEKYHDRIISLHLKDRTADGGNVPWGQGQTPIKEILQLLKKEKWPIYGDIELEYKIPADSDAVKEVARCVQYCKDALA